MDNTKEESSTEELEVETEVVKDNKYASLLSAVVAKVVIIPCVSISFSELEFEIFVDSVVMLSASPFTPTCCRTKAIPISKWKNKLLCG